MKSLTTLCEKIGHQFKDEALLSVALTHRSYSEQNNERLEFLGDSLLNFFIADKLFREHSDFLEGSLSRLRANLVNGETLAVLAGELGIPDYLRLGPGEVKSGGEHRKSTLANTMEAIIGAIYLDGGIKACQKCVLHWYSSRLAMITSQSVQKDPKTKLQEYAQSKKIALPKYIVLSMRGKEHKQIFKVQCQLEEIAKMTMGHGPNRRAAEQDAAAKLLTLLGTFYE